MGVAQFKRVSQKEKPEMTPSRPEGNESLSQVSLDAISRDSADSGGFADGEATFSLSSLSGMIVCLNLNDRLFCLSLE